jgi:hypothetical protein
LGSFFCERELKGFSMGRRKQKPQAPAANPPAPATIGGRLDRIFRQLVHDLRELESSTEALEAEVIDLRVRVAELEDRVE